MQSSRSKKTAQELSKGADFNEHAIDDITSTSGLKGGTGTVGPSVKQVKNKRVRQYNAIEITHFLCDRNGDWGQCE